MGTLFPMFLKLDGRPCLVVGAGTIAESKIDGLLEAAADVTVVAPQATEQVRSWARQGRIVWEQRMFQETDLDGSFLVVSATNDVRVNDAVYRRAQALGVICNVVDDPPRCDFYYPAVVRRGPLQIAISTSGYSPALAQRLRRELGEQFGPEYGVWVEQIGRARAELLSDGAISGEERRTALHAQASASAYDRFVADQTPTLKHTGREVAGKVYLVGAGPGDPELLTLKAARVLANADVVLHDELVNSAILEQVRAGAIVENVGKRSGLKHCDQTAIHEAMISYARQGKSVVRLKGGDPSLFGRLGEELAALRSAEIDFEIVPGVTAAVACAAEAAIPLTDRKAASSVFFLSGHSCTTNPPPDWQAAVDSGSTIVLYMPGDCGALAQRLIRAGMRADTPCAIVANGSLATQEIFSTKLEQVSEVRTAAPKLMIVGEVARVQQLAESGESVSRSLRAASRSSTFAESSQAQLQSSLVRQS